MSVRQLKLPIAALERIDDRCADFERQWRSNQPPTIESMLTDGISGVERDVLLAELLALEIDYRRRINDHPEQQEYLHRFPDDQQVIDEVFGQDQKSRRPFQPPAIAQIAELFPNLQIIELLGAGGMGAVYKARQEGLDRLVALKILPEEFGNDVKSALRFTREARTLAKLNHPNIVSVFEFGSVQDTFYFLMEFVDGSTLREVVTAGELNPQHALAIVPHLCDALQYAHDQGVVHRDIKPENILMGVDGVVKIADFGLSRLLDDETQPTALTLTHQVMGTPRYMAPEQFEGTHGVDHRADIYSLGVVFYEMLTGELPIGRFAAPSQKVAIDVRLDEVVLKTLEKEPQRRYQQASQIKSDVQTIASNDHASSDSGSLDPTIDLAPTIDLQRSQAGEHSNSSVSLQQQELAGRLLLTRRSLLERVENSLRPLGRGQVIQIIIGIALIALGAQCWTRFMHLPHRLVSGVILHLYGLFTIVAAANVLTRIKRIDYSQSVEQIRIRLDAVRRIYLRFGAVIGFAWWLLWIPACVAIGFDAVLYPTCLYPSLVIGIIGIGVSVWLYARVLQSENASDMESLQTKTPGKSWRKKLSGESIAAAYLALDEIERAQIQ